ncbi:hypothetical protein [Streptomyces sp. NPDC005125]
MAQDAKPSTQSPLVNSGLGVDVVYLQMLLDALADADPQAYYAAAQTLEEVAAGIDKVATRLETGTDSLFQAGDGDERWQGKAADTAEASARSLVRRLESIASLIAPWPAQIDSAGEAISNAWRAVNDILANPTP